VRPKRPSLLRPDSKTAGFQLPPAFPESLSIIYTPLLQPPCQPAAEPSFSSKIPFKATFFAFRPPPTPPPTDARPSPQRDTSFAPPTPLQHHPATCLDGTTIYAGFYLIRREFNAGANEVSSVYRITNLGALPKNPLILKHFLGKWWTFWAGGSTMLTRPQRVNPMSILELQRNDTQAVTPAEYIRIYREDRESIESSRVVPPRLGEKNFGVIIIKRNVPFYSLKADEWPRS